MEKEIIVVTMEELKDLLKKQEGEFILHVEPGGGENNAREESI